MNSRDLCLMPKLDELLDAGIDSLKVEGRGKSQYYVSLVARAYRMAIDDYYADPENWSPEPYMKELATVPSRGYTLAFHEGRLTNYAHGYENTNTMADWEFAGVVEAVTDDAFIIDVKNKLEAGDVLDFVSPIRRETMLLRLYEFEDADSGKIAQVINPGAKPKIRIPFSVFDQEEIDVLRNDFPPMTILRKERALTQEQWDRLKLDKESLRLEQDEGSQQTYEKRRDELQTAQDEADLSRTLKTPRRGVVGCCGKGCNGCLVFWHDPTYEKAREILTSRKQGQLLEKKITETAAE